MTVDENQSGPEEQSTHEGMHSSLSSEGDAKGDDSATEEVMGADPDSNKRIKSELVAAAEEDTPCYSQRTASQRHLQPKNNPWSSTFSRKPRYQARRKPVRDSKRIYHAKTMKTKFIAAYLELPGVRAAIQQLRFEQEQGNKLAAPAAPEPASPEPIIPEPSALEPAAPELASPEPAAPEPAAASDVPGVVGYEGKYEQVAVDWPDEVTHSLQLEVANGVSVKDYWPSSRCSCYLDCFAGTCLNAATQLFCAKDSCRSKGKCSNGVYESNNVELFNSRIGVGVRATASIPAGSPIAPYTGLLTDHNYKEDPVQSGYVIELQTRGRGDKKLFIDALHRGTVARFINHDCEPNTQFVEMCHNRDVLVMVKTMRKIATGEEITVDYGDTWFTHACAGNCRKKQDKQMKDESKAAGT